MSGKRFYRNFIDAWFSAEAHLLSEFFFRYQISNDHEKKIGWLSEQEMLYMFRCLSPFMLPFFILGGLVYSLFCLLSWMFFFIPPIDLVCTLCRNLLLLVIGTCASFVFGALSIVFSPCAFLMLRLYRWRHASDHYQQLDHEIIKYTKNNPGGFGQHCFITLNFLLNQRLVYVSVLIKNLKNSAVYKKELNILTQILTLMEVSRQLKNELEETPLNKMSSVFLTYGASNKDSVEFFSFLFQSLADSKPTLSVAKNQYEFIVMLCKKTIEIRDESGLNDFLQEMQKDPRIQSGIARGQPFIDELKRIIFFGKLGVDQTMGHGATPSDALGGGVVKEEFMPPADSNDNQACSQRTAATGSLDKVAGI